MKSSTFLPFAFVSLAAPSTTLAAAVFVPPVSPVHIPLVRLSEGPFTPVEHARKARHIMNRYRRSGVEERSMEWLEPLQAIASNAEYAGNVSIGTPPKPYLLVMDTGSSDLIIAAKDCVGCVANTTSYDPSKSSTATTDGVPFSVRYAIGSASGSLYTDVVQFAGLKVPAQTFALCTNITTVLIAGLSGLLGLAFQPLASTRAVPFFESVVNSGALPTDMFSFALNTAGIAAMTLGGTNTSLYQGGINWIARSGQGAYWSIPLQGVMVGGKELGITATEAVIDTGTSLLGGPAKDVARIFAQIPQSNPIILDGQKGFYSYNCSAVVQLTFVFGNVRYTIPPENFNIGLLDRGSPFCVGSLFAMDPSSSISWLIGNSFLRGFYSAFRFSGPPAIGFAVLGSGGESNLQGINTAVYSGAIKKGRGFWGAIGGATSLGLIEWFV